MVYKDYLKSNHWVSVRKHHLKISRRRRCYLCGSVKSLNVHHMMYKNKYGLSLLGKENSGMLRTLCQECHSLFHKYFEPKNGSTKYYYRIINLLNKNIIKEEAFEIVSRGWKEYRRAWKRVYVKI